MRLGRLGIFADISVAPQVPGTPEEAPPSGENGSTGTDRKPNDPPTAKQTTVPPETTGVPPPAQPWIPPEDAVGQIDLVIRVKDQPTVNVAATVGYADSIGAVGFLDLSENNLLGTGHRVSVEWQRSAQTAINADGTLQTTDSRSAAGFSYQIPPLGLRSIAFGLDVYNRNTVFLPYFAGGRETIRSYERRSGARVQVGKLFSDVVSGFLTLRRDRVGYDPIPDSLNPPLDRLATAQGTVGALGLNLVADGRDAADAPQRGYRYEVQFERAANVLGGDRVFSQMVVDLRQYAPVLRQTAREAPSARKTIAPVVATRLMGGHSTGDVPLSEEFFLGGFDLLRGYDLFSIRGDRFFLGSAELRVPVGPGLQAVGFTDIGTAWLPGARASLNDIKSSIGLGLRFISPIGPIRFDAAYGSRLQTYISLGQSF
jgi:outer membrane protein insertion porin family